MLQLTSKKQQLIRDFVSKYSLELLLLFGSQITGKTHKESDYDVAYLSSRNLSLDEEGGLIIELLAVVGEYDERIVNLVNIKKATPLLLYAMTSKCQIIYQKTPITFATLRAYAFKKYIETKPLYKEKARRLQKEYLKERHPPNTMNYE